MERFVSFLQLNGQDRFAELVAKYPDVVTPFLPKIEKRLKDKGLLVSETVTETVETAGPLTNAQAWRQLAALVPSALSSEPQAVQRALIAEFQRRAAA